MKQGDIIIYGCVIIGGYWTATGSWISWCTNWIRSYLLKIFLVKRLEAK